MARTTEEWIGENDDEAIPPRVKVRIFSKFGGRCSHCTLLIVGKLRPAYDHTIALVNGGQNRERNMSLLCVPCHKVKTRSDVAEKSMVARKRMKHLGIAPKRQKIQSAGFRKAPPQHTATRPIERRNRGEST